MTSKPRKTKVCYVLSYKSPEYTRSAVLIEALRNNDDIELILARNSSKSLMRYVETIVKLLTARIRENPDVYILGFRGYEILGIVRVITAGKPLIFDEFINLDNWLVNERKKLGADSILRKFLKMYFRFLLKHCAKILTDTNSHAQSSSQTYGIPLNRYTAIPVGADERLFKKIGMAAKADTWLNAFFYGTLLPLHGAEKIIDAAILLKRDAIRFTIVGGKPGSKALKTLEHKVKSNKLANVAIIPEVPYRQLPGLIASSDVCLGGPFGDTPQSKLVVTGKTYQFLAMAKPTIIGRVDDLEGLVDKKNCLIVEQGNPKTIADALRWCMKNRSKLKGIGEAGAKHYNKNYSIAAISLQLKDLLGAYE